MYVEDDDLASAGFDTNGHGTLYFYGAGYIDFDLDYTDCYEDCMALYVDHPDWWYSGYYYNDGTWNGYPHFTDGMGAHLYFHESWSGTGSGWWQFDNRVQDGTNDYFDGGYFWCDVWNCFEYDEEL